MRLHPEPGSKLYAKGPHWRYCTDLQCSLQHVTWTPFWPIPNREEKTGQPLDLSYLQPTNWKKRAQQ